VDQAVIFNPGHLLFMDTETAGPHVVKADSSYVFEEVFKAHFQALHHYAFTIVRDEVIAEEMVQNVFCKLWEKREELQVQGAIKSYLYRAVHNGCLNWLKQQKGRARHHDNIFKQSTEAQHDHDGAEFRQLKQRIQAELNELPEQCRTVFQLSRFEELNYKEIAETMGITVSTVKNHMNKALRVLRTKLTDYLPVLLFLLLNNKNY
jgi:RNA polymerase sigma-70 factor, ECF subfamily